MGEVQLVNWCICAPTRRAFKTGSRSRLSIFALFFAFIRIGREIQCLPYAGFLDFGMAPLFFLQRPPFQKITLPASKTKKNLTNAFSWCFDASQIF